MTATADPTQDRSHHRSGPAEPGKKRCVVSESGIGPSPWPPSREGPAPRVGPPTPGALTRSQRDSRPVHGPDPFLHLADWIFTGLPTQGPHLCFRGDVAPLSLTTWIRHQGLQPVAGSEPGLTGSLCHRATPVSLPESQFYCTLTVSLPESQFYCTLTVWLPESQFYCTLTVSLPESQFYCTLNNLPR